MKQKIDFQWYIMLAGGFIFQLLFWNELFGVNLLFYSIFILLVTFTSKQLPLSKSQALAAISHLAIACYIVYNNSNLAIVTWVLTLLVFVGQTHFPLIKSVVTSIALGVLQLISGPYGIVTKLQTTKLGKINFKPFTRPIKFVIVPILLVVIFCSMYANANAVFAKYVFAITHQINALFSNIFNFLFVDISFAKCFMILIGILITAALLISLRHKELAEIEVKATEQLVRKRRNRQLSEFLQDFRTLLAGNQANKVLGLKTENIIGIISLVALNLLLLLLNSIDIVNLWLTDQSLAIRDFSGELHDGTSVLIFSIVIAMIIIVYFFSGNLNFYHRNKWIKLLAFLWIAQNIFLVASVLRRDYDYIFYHGLTYKRIGVIVFALLCLVGLSTVYIKVAKQKTVFYLYRVNAKVWYALLLLFSFVNWDTLMVNYNFSIAEKIGIDVDHLMSFSDKTLPILQQKRTLLVDQVARSAQKDDYRTVLPTVEMAKESSSADTSAVPVELRETHLRNLAIKQATDEFNRRLDGRIRGFLQDQKSRTWLSFSYLTFKTKVELLKR